jgi:hypothetical protein
LRISLVSVLFIALYFLLIGWAVSICELEFYRLFEISVEFPPYQHLLPAPGRAAVD